MVIPINALYNPSLADLMVCYHCEGELELPNSSPNTPVFEHDFTNNQLNGCWNPVFDETEDTPAIPCSTKCYTRALVLKGWVFFF